MHLNEIVQSPIFQWLSQFAFQPQYVYLAVVGMMVASAFGLPVPEEVTLISVGFLAFMGTRPDLFPPPEVGASVINMHEAAWFCFFAVVGSDFLIYWLGRRFGRRLIEHPRFQKVLSPAVLKKIESMTHRYGPYAVFVFRFTPGIRFPGHLACGILKFDRMKFILVDACAALISVPTQIYLIALHGDKILSILQKFKLGLLALLVVVIVFVAVKRWRERKLTPPDSFSTSQE